MKDAQKVYKKQGGASQNAKSNRSRKIRGGAEGEGESTPVADENAVVAAGENGIVGGKSRRNRRGKRGGKSQRKARRGGKSQRKAQR